MADAIRKGRRDGRVHIKGCRSSSSRTPGWRLVCGLAACASAHFHRPNCAVKGTPPPVRALRWPSGRPLPWALGPRVNAPRARAKRATYSVATGSQACASWFAQGLVACLHSSWRQPSIQHTGAHAHAVTCHHRPNWALQGTPPPLHASATPSARP